MSTRRLLGVLLLASAIAGASSTPVPASPRLAVTAGAGSTAPSSETDGVGPEDGHDHAGHDHNHDHGEADGHEADEGLALRPQDGESVDAGGTTCGGGAPVRRYDVVAMAVDITLNRYGDHDPQGRAYVLATEVEAVGEAAAAGPEAVSLGLQGDTIQPLVLRALPGECLQVVLANQLADEPASFHLHSSSLVVAATGEAATAANPDAMAEPGGTVAYEWAVPGDEREGTRTFHSHGAPRLQSGHGLFGTLVVEPPGATWLDPRTGRPGTTGWDAVVRTPEGSFREYVLAYHEIGDEEYRIARAEGGTVPQVDPITGAYRPAARAINYRSEPFLNRLELQEQLTGQADESLAYSSYAFGDPATPVLRSYVGDPVKQRVAHAGGETFHVHHVHGGSVRWRRQPGAGPTDFGTGLTKQPSLSPGPSERTDSQSLGPSEAFDVDHECSAGGCQQGAGDYLVHCHVAHHYFAGMWGIWRVYNTLQDGPSSTDALPPLPPLTEREESTAVAVDSSQLDVAERERARRHLPPAGRPGDYDASVWDWVEEGGRILGEPEDGREWPGHRPVRPGERPPVLFDPASGRPAYPLLRPHLGARPPFAPGNGPSPYLDTPTPDGEPPPPGADGPTSLCPSGTTPRQVALRAIELPVPLNRRAGLVDPAGALFVLAEDEAAVRADPERRTPLAIRANAGEDCLDVLLTNTIPDNANHPFSKVSAHIHFVQFDVQGGDGVDTGFNFEQTVRPFAADGQALATAAPAGSTSLSLPDAGRFAPGALIGIGMDQADRFEVRRVVAREGSDVLVLDRPLTHDHGEGEIVSTEFVRYRWYPDAQVGTSYFHDHVNGLQTWQRGLVGALVVEPPGSTYHDPRTGEEIRSGPIADVRVPPDAAVSADVQGSFRELVSFVQDGSRLSNVGRSAGSKLNLRAEPLSRRPGPPDRAFSSALHGDPETPLLEAYVGDPVVVRATVSGTNEVHTWHLDGHWFRREPWSTGSAPTTTAHLGISERMDLVIPAAGGPQRRAGDYLYADGRALKLEEGAWGLLRVHARPEGIASLPGRPPPTGEPPPVCPAEAPRQRLEVAAVETRLAMLGARPGRAFVPAAEADAVLSGARPVSPLVLRATVGDCLEVTLANRLPSGAPAVSLHADGLAFDPLDSGGVEAGRNPSQVVEVGEHRTYTFFAHPEYGPGAAMLRDGGDLARSGALGLYGAVVISPAGAELTRDAGWSAIVTDPDGTAWRDVVLFSHDEDDALGGHRMPYARAVRGALGLNYGNGDDGPTIEARAGDRLRVHVLAPWSEQVQVFSMEGHRWPLEPGMPGSNLVDSVALGGLESITVVPEGGAGGRDHLPGTYWIGNHREPYREAGMSGRLVVHPRCSDDVAVAPLPGAGGCGDGEAWAAVLGGTGALALLGAAIVWRSGRRRSATLARPSPTEAAVPLTP
ncbi:MAG: multicopper oxidase domain-containing protein [Actinobacteria bacterium]|nr:multicopper oxidase domain-containing protein [Actinomycetota bacterium]